MTTENTFTIPLIAWADFVAKITKLNRKAAKLGCDPITYTVTGEGEVTRAHTFKTEDGEYTKTYKVMARTIELHGSAPKLEGWQFIARIEYLSDSKSVLFHSVPGSEIKIDERFRALTPAACEHCNKIRIRKDTFVVRNIETGAQTQVGRQCLADFTGINTPEQIAAKASFLSSFTDLRDECERWFGKHFATTIDTLHVLSLTSAYIAANGWIPRSACLETSTATQVGEHFWLSKSIKREQSLAQMAEQAKAEGHQDRAKRVIVWIKDELANKARSDYEHNLVTLVANDLMEQKHLGIICSAVAAYQRAMNQQVEYAKKRETVVNSAHVGEIGKRMRGHPVRIEFVKMLEAGIWGSRTLVKFLDDSGNLFTWFASGDHDYKTGARVKIDATVKGHRDNQGVKETQLSRVIVQFTEATTAAN